MEKLIIDLQDRAYPILIGAGLLSEPAAWTANVAAADVFVITNDTVAGHWLAPLQRALRDRRLEVLALPDGERFKTFQTLGSVFDAMVAARMNRDCCVLALGGGVVGDIAGFAAACYQRGVSYVQVPTTLLAQVDSSVGGKTAVDHPGGKNLIGAFHQPVAVVTDTNTLSTLPDRELRAGLAEVIKYGLAFDTDFLDWIDDHLEGLLERRPDDLTHAIRRSCEHKAHVVRIDEREQGPRALLNLGHTFGHAIETATEYGAYLHGEAVALGMVLAAETSHRLGWLTAADVARVRDLLRRAGLPVSPPRVGRARMLELMAMDKKVKAGRLRLVLLERLGAALLTADYDPAALGSVLDVAVGGPA
jgi:3-dehydroquinate synthase